ncbi:MAG: Mitochondrial processing peptidase-like protein, partial [uncultured Rubellimicrobium sp.]
DRPPPYAAQRVSHRHRVHARPQVRLHRRLGPGRGPPRAGRAERHRPLPRTHGLQGHRASHGAGDRRSHRGRGRLHQRLHLARDDGLLRSRAGKRRRPRARRDRGHPPQPRLRRRGDRGGARRDPPGDRADARHAGRHRLRLAAGGRLPGPAAGPDYPGRDRAREHVRQGRPPALRGRALRAGADAPLRSGRRRSRRHLPRGGAVVRAPDADPASLAHPARGVAGRRAARDQGAGAGPLRPGAGGSGLSRPGHSHRADLGHGHGRRHVLKALPRGEGEPRPLLHDLCPGRGLRGHGPEHNLRRHLGRGYRRTRGPHRRGDQARRRRHDRRRGRPRPGADEGRDADGAGEPVEPGRAARSDDLHLGTRSGGRGADRQDRGRDHPRRARFRRAHGGRHGHCAGRLWARRGRAPARSATRTAGGL